MPTSTSDIKSALKETLSNIVDDRAKTKANLIFPEYMEVKRQFDNWEDDQEYAGPGLAAEKAEGSSVSIGLIEEGSTYRYLARTYAIGLVVTEEAIEDNKYDKAINAAKNCRDALFNTADTDAALLPARGFNTAFTFGDGQPLWSASHPLVQGGTFSNLFATPLPPSVAAVSQARVQAQLMPGHHGVVSSLMLEKVVAPVDQESEWERILNSKLDTDSGNNFSRINVAQRMSLKMCVNPFWDNTTSNYFFTTNAKHGIQFRWRREARGRSSDGFDQGTVKFKCDARWTWGHSNPRGTIGVEA